MRAYKPWEVGGDGARSARKFHITIVLYMTHRFRNGGATECSTSLTKWWIVYTISLAKIEAESKAVSSHNEAWASVTL